jgi:hypothetical protein
VHVRGSRVLKVDVDLLLVQVKHLAPAVHVRALGRVPTVLQSHLAYVPTHFFETNSVGLGGGTRATGAIICKSHGPVNQEVVAVLELLDDLVAAQLQPPELAVKPGRHVEQVLPAVCALYYLLQRVGVQATLAELGHQPLL